VKKCLSCAKDIPDTAFHCVFCGAKQGAPQVAGPAQRTIMGYAASDLQKLLPNQQQGGAPQQPQGYVQAGADQRTMMAGVGGAPLPPPPNDQRTMMAGAGGAPMPPMPPMQPVQPMGGYGQQPMQPMQPMPPTGPGGYGQPQGGYAQQQGGYGQQPPIAMPGPSGQRPQYLASQSAARDMAPTEPWAGSLRSMMIIFGLVLVATVVLPLSFDPMTFMWKVLTTPAPMEAKLWPLVLAAGGLLSLLFGLLPVPTAARGIVAAIVGILPFIVMAIVGAPGGGVGGALPFGGWQGYMAMAGLILAPTGLLLRSQYRGSGLARVLTLIGCGAIIALFLIPAGGTLPIVGMLKSLGSGGVAHFLPLVWMLALVAAAALGLIMTIMPSSVSLGTSFFAWIIISWLFGLSLIAIVVMIIGGGPIGALFKAPASIAFIVDFLAWPALAAYGLATTFGKSLEA
jgi:hypothetical protein